MFWRCLLLIMLVSSSQLCAGTSQLAIIIDDIGYNGPLGRRATDLEGAFTLAVLPLTPHSHELAQRAYRQGKEIMLHAPMSNTKNLPLGRGGLESGMSKAGFLAQLRQNIADIPHLRGVNNHMGSKLTQEPETMGWLMNELAQRHLYFIDSRTTAKSQALAVAQAYQVSSSKRDIFLDNQRTAASIQQQVLKAIKMARQHGQAIAIGHPYPETLAVLAKIQPLLADNQVELVAVSRLLAPLSTTPGTCYAPPQSLWVKVNSGPQIPDINVFTRNLFAD